MLFLTLYTPAKKMTAPPSAEHMAKMIALIEAQTKAGNLVTMGGLTRNETGGARVILSNGKYAVSYGPFGNSTLMPAGGYALIRANDREDAVRVIREFLAVAGDGQSEVLQVMEEPPQRS